MSAQYKFIKLKDESNVHDISNVEISFETVCRDELIRQFEVFLRACEFSVEGMLEVVENELPNDEAGHEID